MRTSTNEFNQTMTQDNMWGLIYKITNVLCSDGKRRVVRMTTGHADTFSSIPGYTRVGKKAVSGFVTSGDSGYEFVAYENRKNGNLLPRNKRLTD